MRRWRGSLSQWSNSLLIHGLSGWHSTITEEWLRCFCYAAQREGFRGEKAARNGWCRVCNELYVVCFAWECFFSLIFMSLYTQTHLLLFKCTFSLGQHRKVGQQRTTSINSSRSSFGIWCSFIFSGKLWRIDCPADKPWYDVTYLFYWFILLYMVGKCFQDFLKREIEITVKKRASPKSTTSSFFCT